MFKIKFRHSSHLSLPRQIVTLVFALFLMGLGIAVTTQAGLGTSPVSAIPYVLTFILPLSFGTTTFIVNFFQVLGQRIMVGKSFPAFQWCQLCVSLTFGVFIDLGMWLSAPLMPETYVLRVVNLLLGSALLACGIALEVHADLLYVPGEGFVKALCRPTHLRFSSAKIVFDVSNVLIAMLISAAFLGKVCGLREGTVIAAFAVGLFLKKIIPLTRPFRRWVLTAPRKKVHMTPHGNAQKHHNTKPRKASHAAGTTPPKAESAAGTNEKIAVTDAGTTDATDAGARREPPAESVA